ncbi:MAG: hypothetical protein M1839_005491 [Geoglossum umbratile]|nr:MAG: hypothetical protein M1839_005491 [Geoglossum umbratile]
MSRPLPRPQNSQRYKNLPLPSPPQPLLSHLEMENSKLKGEKKKLEMLVEVLYKQNLQYSEVLNQREALDKEVRKEMDRTVRVMAGVANMQLQNHSKMRAIGKQIITDWEEFYSDMRVEEADSIEEVLEDIKERAIEKNLRGTEEVMIGIDFRDNYSNSTFFHLIYWDSTPTAKLHMHMRTAFSSP